MKKLFSVLLVLIFVLSCFSILTSATESGTCGGSLTWTLDDNGTLTISGFGEMSNYGTYYSYQDPVPTPWENSKEKIKSVIIGNSVVSIGNYAFSGCTGLTSITISDSVINIGNYSFEGCTGLTGINIPNSIKSIGTYAFSDCSGLTGITIPDNVTSIRGFAFKGCTSLKNITVDGNNKNYCSADGVLYNKNKTDLLCYPAGKSNSSFVVPDSVTSIENFSFYNCSGLTDVTIGNGVTEIGLGTFGYCISLASVTIPKSIKSIGNSAFSECTSLKNVYYEGSNKDDITIDGGNESFINATWHYNQTMPDNPAEPELGIFDTIVSAVSNFFTTIGNTISSIFASIAAFFKNMF